MGATDIEGLTARAEAGSADAQRRLAFALEEDGQAREAARWLIRASNAGDLDAMIEIGRRLLVGRGAPKDPVRGATLILAAASRGSARAMAMAGVIYAVGVLAPPDWAAALKATRMAATLGDAPAIAQLEVLGAQAERLEPPAAEPISEAPRLWWVRDIAPPKVCAWLSARAGGRLDVATVYNTDLGRLDADANRSNTLFEIDLAECDLVAMWLRLRIARALQLPQDRLEASNVLHYAPGQRFGRHFDFLQPNAPVWADELATKGQRIATALVYLNEDYEGGETDFLKLGQRFKGRRGDALFFMNVDPRGQPDVATLHEGRAPTSGEKWLFSQFVRDRKQV